MKEEEDFREEERVHTQTEYRACQKPKQQHRYAKFDKHTD